MREYGRNVQNMVQQALAEEDLEKRTAICHGIMKLMERLRPAIRQEEDYKHKLWDHLNIIGDYNLNIEMPYDVPDRETIEARPERLVYPQSRIKRKHYGKNLEALIQKCIETEDPEKREEFKMLIAGFMKMVYKNWHKDNVADEQLAEDLRLLSNDELTLEEGTVVTALDNGVPSARSNANRRTNNRTGGRVNRKTNSNSSRGRTSNNRGRSNNNRGRQR